MSLSVSATQALYGSNSLQCVSTGVAFSQVWYTVSTANLGPLTGVAHVLNAKFRLWIPSGVTTNAATWANFRVTYTDASVVVSSPAGTNITGADNWVEITLNPIVTNPAKAIQAVQVYLIGPGAQTSPAATYYIDAVDIRVDESDAAEYIDGSLGPYYFWVGAANASVSYYYAAPTGITRSLSSIVPVNPDGVWRDGPSAFEISITKPGDVSPIVLTASGVSCNWVYTGQQQLSAEVLTSDVLAAFGTIDLRGRWIRYDHKTLGVWAGQITECEADLATGTLEIAATDFSSLLESRRLAKVYDVTSSTAGALFRRIIVDSQREVDLYSWIRLGGADETGDPLDIELRGGTVLEAVEALESNSNEEWYVDENRNAYWTRRRGRNRTAAVQLVENIHVAGGRYTLALGPIKNDLLVVPANEAYASSESFVIDDDDSIKRYGRRQEQLTYTTGVTKASLLPVARRDLNRLKSLGDTIEFDVVNVALNDVSCAFESFREGDSIMLLLPGVNRNMQVRVLARSYDTNLALLHISADIES
jgi:hypothetical protein